MSSWVFCASARARLAVVQALSSRQRNDDWWRHLPVRWFIRSFFCCETHEHDILKTINRFWCHVAQVVHGAIKLSTLGSGGQRSRSHEVENRFGGLAEASVSTTFGRVAFLVSFHRAVPCIARTMPSQDVCLSVHPSVCPSVKVLDAHQYFRCLI